MPRVTKVGRFSHKPRRRRRSGLPIFIVLFLMISLGSFAFAVLEGKELVDAGLMVESEPPKIDAANTISDIELPDSSEAPSSSRPAVVFGVPLPESERVDSTYFNDAVFFGDSVTDGITLYQTMANAKVIAFTGINPATTLTREVIKTDAGDAKIPMINALGSMDPGKIYIMIGINSIADNKDSFISSYGNMLDAIIAQHPEATIYVQPITPVTAKFETSSKNTYDITNAKINEYNSELLRLSGEKRVYYVNVSEALSDETGALPDEASPKDGIHFGAKYYEKWFEYLKTHTAPPKS